MDVILIETFCRIVGVRDRRLRLALQRLMPTLHLDQPVTPGSLCEGMTRIGLRLMYEQSYNRESIVNEK